MQVFSEFGHIRFLPGVPYKCCRASSLANAALLRYARMLRVGKCSLKIAESIRFPVESLLSDCITGVSDRDISLWLADISELQRVASARSLTKQNIGN